MKKYLRTILCLLLAPSMVFCFAACSDSDKDEDEDEDSVAGTYYFYEMTEDGETISTADMESQLEAYAEYMEEEISLEDFFYLELNEDGTGKMCMMGVDMEMEWNEDSIWPVDEPDEPVEYTVSGKKLTMSQDGTTIVLKKK